MILTSIRAGVRRMARTRRMIVLFYLANLAFGVVVMLPFRSAVSAFAGETLMGNKLSGGIDIDFLVEYLLKNSTAVTSEGGLIAVAAALYWIFTIVLSGGAISVLAGDESSYRARLFWGEDGAWCGRFLRLALWSLPVFGILFCIQYLETGAVLLAFGKDPYQSVTFWGGLVKLALLYAGILLYGAIFDYARIYAVLTGEQTMRRALWQGVLFVLRNPFRAFSLTALLFLGGLLALALYNLVVDALPAPPAAALALLLIVQQLYMVFRMGLKITLYASELHLFREISPPVARQFASGDGSRPEADLAGEVALR